MLHRLNDFKISIQSLISLSVIFLLLIAGIVIQSQIYMSHDVAWHIMILKRLLQGGSYTHDFMDISPPAIMYSKLPIIWLMDTMNWSMPVALRCYLFLLSIVSLYLCHLIFNHLYAQRDFFKNVVLITLSFCFFCLPLFELGQRDSMVLILIMPWIMAYACALSSVTLSPSLRVIIALCAGLGFIIHIVYLFIYVGLELYLIFKKYPVRYLENSIILLVISCYLLCVIILNPDYISLIIPLVSWVYLGMYNNDWITMLCSLPSLGAFMVLGLFFAVKKSPQHQSLLNLLFVMQLLFLIPYLLTGKLWYYHILPPLTFTFILLGALVFEAKLLHQTLMIWVLSAVSILPIGQYTTTAEFALENSSPASQLTQLIDFVKQHGAGSSIYVFSDKMWPQVLIPYAHVTIASRMAPTWLALGLVAKEQSLSGADKLKFAQIKQLQFRVMDDDLLKYKPTLILVAKSPIDFINFFKQDPEFRVIWSHYLYAGELNNHEIYFRDNK